MNAAQIHFVTTQDGTSIAYSVLGIGLNVLVLRPIGMNHLSLELQVPHANDLYAHLASQFSLVRFDLRGCGLSSRHTPTPTLDLIVADIEAVLDKLGLHRVPIFTFGVAATIAIYLAATRPERISRLVILEGAFPGSGVASLGLLEQFEQAAATRARLALLGEDLAGEWATAYAAVYHATADSETYRLLFRLLDDFNVEAVMPAVRVPTLFIHAAGDPVFPLRSVQEQVTKIADAQLLVIDGNSPVAAMTNQQGLNAALEFLGRSVPVTGRTQGELSLRELEVLRLIALGRTNPQIADELVISRNTVQNHVASILTKAGLANRAEAAAYAERHGLT
jgi:pimeloyl-ACP methyl ester carboxylesterase/DNA-binding CsgD family transcriptional regulator